MLIKKTMSELNRAELEPHRESLKLPIIVALENIRSGLNIGSVFRTADAFCIHSILLSGISMTPPHREILKTALDATLSVNWTYAQSLPEKLIELKTLGYQIIAVEQTQGSISLDQFKFIEHIPGVLVFGNEVSGVSDEVLKICDHAVEIPQAGIKHSLNIAVCAGILLWQAYDQLHQLIQ